MDERIPKRRVGQRARGYPYRRRAADPEYARAFVMAHYAIVHDARTDQRTVGEATRRLLWRPSVRATDAGEHVERILGSAEFPPLDLLDELVTIRGRWLAEIVPEPNGTASIDGAASLNEALPEAKQSIYDGAFERLRRRGHGPEELALFAEVWQRAERRGGGVDALLLLVATVECAARLEDGPSRLASLLCAYRSLDMRSADVAYLSYLVTRDLLVGRLEGLLAAAAYDLASARIAIEAYAEATALAFHLDQALRSTRYPADLTGALFDYYLTRRTEHHGDIARAEGALVYGTDTSGEVSGPLFRLGENRYRRLPQSTRELVVETYCAGFLRALRHLPIEALLLCPGHAISYALEAAKHDADRQLPRITEVDLSDEQVQREVAKARREAWTEEEWSAGSAFVHLPHDGIESLGAIPHIELYVRWLGGTVTKKQLAAEVGISRPTLDARLGKAQAYIDAIKAGRDAPLGKRPTAERFLRMVLRDGPVRKSEVVRLGRTEGIAKRTLERAAEGVVRGGGAREGRTWSLPADDSDAE